MDSTHTTTSGATPLRTTLTHFHRNYTLANPTSHAKHQRAAAHLPGGNTRTAIHAAPFPLTLVLGRGTEVTSADGRVYLDFLSEYSAGLLGHRNDRIVSAVNEALMEGYSFGGSNIYEQELARLVVERYRPTIELVRFTNSGTEANTWAIATAKAWTGRTKGKILAFDMAYHGSGMTFGLGVSLAEDPTMLPHEWIVGKYGDVNETKTLLASIAKDDLAAIILEPFQTSSGGNKCSFEFLAFLRDEATARGALLIFDEIMTSRLGYRGVGAEMGVRPDLMTLGKWIGGGMTVGAFGGRRDIMSMFDPRRTDGKHLIHAGTFNNNIVTMAAGCEAFSIYDETEVRLINDLGDKFRDMVNKALAIDGLGRGLGRTQVWMSGRGSINTLRFEGNDADAYRAIWWHWMLSKGIYTSQRGFTALNLEHTEKHLEVFVDALKGFVRHFRLGFAEEAKL